MNASELEALAAQLYAQINHGHSDARIELNEVKSWIASRKKEAESCPEPLFFFLNLV